MPLRPVLVAEDFEEALFLRIEYLVERPGRPLIFFHGERAELDNRMLVRTAEDAPGVPDMFFSHPFPVSVPPCPRSSRSSRSREPC